MDPANPKTLFPSTSAVTYWQIELQEGPVQGTSLLNLTKVRPLFSNTLLHRGSDNSPLLIVLSAYYIDQSVVTFMRLKVG